MSESFIQIQTKSSLLKKNSPETFQVVAYESYKAKPKKPKQQNEDQKDQTSQQNANELDMKQARHEIFKFGMSGFDPEKKQEAKIQLAIKLGAKPPKNKHKNYKQLQLEKKKNIEKQKDRIAFEQLGKNQAGRSTAKGRFFKKKKGPSGLLDHWGKPTLKDKKSPKK